MEVLREILLDKINEKETFKEADYDNPSWAFLAADRNGYNRALNEVLNLITFNKKEDHVRK